MTKVLGFGGTRFFGTHLVRSLIDSRYKVTIATRGRYQDPFGSEVERVVLDRTKEDTFPDSIKDGHWDLVYDQICYSSKGAELTTRLLKGKVEHYIHTSTGSVYDNLPDQLSCCESGLFRTA